MFQDAVVAAALERYCATLPSFTIRDQRTGSPYLTRYYVWPKGEPGQLRHEVERNTPFGVYIHKFHRSDKDRHPHNHPWDESIALILAYGYIEEKDGRTRVYKPGDVNVITKNDFHRVTLLNEEAGSWSLFVAGRRMQNWGFRDDDGDVIPWKEYLGLP